MSNLHERFEELESRLESIEKKVNAPKQRRYHRGKTVSFNVSLDRHKFLSDLLNTGDCKTLSELMRLAVDLLIASKKVDYESSDSCYGEDDDIKF